MITWNDLYNVLTAVVPLYVAMMVAYGSVRWWKIFTPDQCSGINRFVAVFAVPLLSFHFISTNDPYTMNLRFIAADTLQKIATLFVLAAWTKLISDRTDTVEWMITIFSLSTLPNTLVMGIPLLVAMYGPYSGNLMVQVVVLQCIVWYTLLLFLFEYRGARMLIMEQFPETAGSIVSFKVDTDVVSLVDGKDMLQTDAAITGDGKVHVTVRKSNASRQSLPRSSFSALITPRPSNLTGAEIYSLSSSRNPTPRSSNFNNSGGYCLSGGQGIPARHSSFDDISATETVNPKTQSRAIHDAKELHMFFWSNTASPVPDIASPEQQPGRRSGLGPRELRMFVADLPRNGEKKTVADGEVGAEKIKFEGGRVDAEERERGRPESTGLSKEVTRSAEAAELHPKAAAQGGSGKQMPPARVMTRLILIMVWRKLIRNPNTYSSLLGLLWSLVAFRCHLSMPDIIEKSISILSNAGLGMAMFSLGLFMALQPKIIACGNSVASFAMAIRFIVGPAIMAAASIVVGVRGTLLRIAIVQAALPQGIVPFVFAKEYNVYPAILSTAVIFGMLIALPITLVYYILLGL